MRKHLVMKLIYAGTFVLLLLGSAFLFIHPGVFDNERGDHSPYF